jgi:hypothetical protein
MQDVVTDNTADFSAFGECLTAGSVRLRTADPDWHAYIRLLFPRDNGNSFCDQSAFSAATEHGIRGELGNILRQGPIEKCCERVRGLLTDSRSAIRDS